MKIKPASKPGAVVVELGPNEAQLPGAVPFNLKRILVPVDFSECSKKALAYAVPFAKQFEAELTLLYVVQPYVPVPEMVALDTTTLLAQMRSSGKTELDKLRASLPAGLRTRALLREGRPATEIVRAAAELDADLILLSTHGRTGLGRFVLGSVAEHVTRYAGCPVLTVRERQHEFVDTEAAAVLTKRTDQARAPRREMARA